MALLALMASTSLACRPATCPACPPPYVEPPAQSPLVERCDRTPTAADLQAQRDDWQEAAQASAGLAPLRAAHAAYTRGDDEACATYSYEAQELDASSVAARLIHAACDHRRGRARLARAELRELLERPDAHGARWEPLVRRWSERLSAQMPRVNFRLEGPYRPEHVRFSFAQMAVADLSREFSVDPGRHRVHAERVTPRAETQRDVEAKLGCTLTIPLRLERAIPLCLTPEEAHCAERMQSSESAGRACLQHLEECRRRCEAAGRR